VFRFHTSKRNNNLDYFVKNTSLTKKKEYTTEQKLTFSRYKRFKARCGISCSYQE
jgi:hypothetical protein